jgi:hypothetical protein
MWSVTAGVLFVGFDETKPGDFVLVGSVALAFGGVGALVLNQVVGALYELVLPKGQIICVGILCFRWGFVFLAGCSVIMGLLVLTLFIRKLKNKVVML